MWQSGLWDEEILHIERSVPKRRREFTAGRNCLRRALVALGHPEVAIGVGPNREPLLPHGYVGSITHTDDYCAAALLHKRFGVSIGIDAEPKKFLERDVVDLILRPSEQRHVDDLCKCYPGLPWDRMIFSAKEAFHKALFRIWPVMLDFLDAEVTVRPNGGKIDLTLPGLCGGAMADGCFEIYFRFDDELILTSALLPMKDGSF